jgi:hypothetical protein
MRTFFQSIMRGGRTHKRQAAQRKVGRGSPGLRVLCSVAASVAALALVVPAAATATSKSKLIAEAKLSMRVETKSYETNHLIPYKRSTSFVLSCGTISGHRILCREHHGPKRCVNGKPWTQLSDIFPVIKGTVGLSLDGGLTTSSVYCAKTH